MGPGDSRPRPAAPPSWIARNRALRAEAAALLDGGLRDVLSAYGAVHVVGSHAMGLMAWRDLDIHLVPEVLDGTAFFDLGRRLADLLAPRKMHYRDETAGRNPVLPNGLYWGVHLGDARQGAWKLDIWATDPAGLVRVQKYCRGIAGRLSADSREAILRIKAACWQAPGFRRDFNSADIYDAVLDHGIRDVRGFRAFLEQKQRRRRS